MGQVDGTTGHRRRQRARPILRVALRLLRRAVRTVLVFGAALGPAAPPPPPPPLMVEEEDGDGQPDDQR